MTIRSIKSGSATLSLCEVEVYSARRGTYDIPDRECFVSEENRPIRIEALKTISKMKSTRNKLSTHLSRQFANAFEDIKNHPNI